MVFGDRQVFAIEFNWEQVINEQNFGRFFFWIGGERIGDPEDDGVYLNGCINWLKDCYQSPGNRREPDLYAMDASDAKEVLRSTLASFGPDARSLHRQFGDLFSRFFVGHIGMSSFDALSLTLIENESGAQRFLWWQKDGEAKDAFLPPGELEKRAREVVAWCEANLEHMPASPPAKPPNRRKPPN